MPRTALPRPRHFDFSRQWDRVHALEDALATAGIMHTQAGARAFIAQLPASYKSPSGFWSALRSDLLTRLYQTWSDEGSLGEIGDPDEELAKLENSNGHAEAEIQFRPQPTSSRPRWEEIENRLDALCRDAIELGDVRLSTYLSQARRRASAQLDAE